MQKTNKHKANKNLIALLVQWNPFLHPTYINSFLVSSKTENTNYINELINEEKLSFNNELLIINTHNTMQSIIEECISYEFPDNYHFMYYNIIKEYYKNGIPSAIEMCIKYILRINTECWGFLGVKLYYDLAANLLIKCKVNINQHAEILDFIDHCITLYKDSIVYQHITDRSILVLLKARGLAKVIGNKRAYCTINILLLVLNTYTAKPSRATKLNIKFLQEIETMALADEDFIQSTLVQQAYLAHIQGKLLISFQLFMQGMLKDSTSLSQRQKYQLHSIALSSLAAIGDFQLCYYTAEKIYSEFHKGRAFILALPALFQGEFKKVLDYVKHIAKDMQAYQVEHCNFLKASLLGLYFIYKNKPRNTYALYKKFMYPLYQIEIQNISISFCGEVILEIFYSNYITLRNQETYDELSKFLKLFYSGIHCLRKCTAARIYGKLAFETKDYEKALQFFNEALGIAQLYKVPHEILLNNIQLAKVYTITNNRKLAKTHAQEAYKYKNQFSYITWDNDLNIYLNQIDKLEEITSVNIIAEVISNLRTQLQAINDWQDIKEYITRIIAALLSTFGASEAMSCTIENNKIKFESFKSIDNAIENEIKQYFSEKEIANVFNMKHSSYHKLKEKKSKNYTIYFYIPVKNYKDLVIGISGILFENIHQKINIPFIQHVSEILSDYLFVTITTSDRRLQKAVIFTQTKGTYLNFESEAMQKILLQTKAVAETDVSILLLGESGVGKEVLAKKIYEFSKQKGPFIAVNLSSIPESLYESEMHGYEKGAFTNAIKQRIGFFELANAGTLFIDEVGDISPAIQVKLLRVLQEKCFNRVGGSKEIHSNFRLIAATNRNLKEEILKNNFREDLFYRLNVFPIRIPSLRERQQDIISLTYYFLEYFSNKHRKLIPKFSAHDIQFINSYEWPGNIRELKNVIERYVILNSADTPLSIGSFIKINNSPDNMNSLTEKNDISQLYKSYPSIKELEEEYFNFLFKVTNGKIDGDDGMANMLQLSRQQVYKRIKQFKIREKYKKGYFIE